MLDKLHNQDMLKQKNENANYSRLDLNVIHVR